VMVRRSAGGGVHQPETILNAILESLR